jgi:hypothetical protein
MMRIFIGYDSREPLAYHVCAHSILSRASRPVSITPLTLQSVQHVYTRPRGPLGATEFSLTRFLVPYLCDYQGVAVFMDSDMLVQCDIATLANYSVADTAVLSCQHDYIPKSVNKMDGQQQTVYPRKNWSSFMVFNNAQCRALTPEYVNTATGLMLHRFWWTEDACIGSLPLEWNYLVGEGNQSLEQPKILHYTNGTPIFPGYEHCDHADLWLAERDAMLGEQVPA